MMAIVCVFVFCHRESEVRQMKKKAAGLLAAAMLLCTAQMAGAEPTQGAEEKITVNLASRILTFWRNGKKIRMYPVAVGKPQTQTPTGEFSVIDMEVNPTWVDPKDTKKKVESGEDNPLGYRWMGIGGHYGIHGTNLPDSIGGYVSNGCIRLWEENAEELYELTDIGTPVEIDYERVVIENTSDDQVAFYIYPDGYHRQHLDVSAVKQELAEFGVADFISDAEIEEKIEASDGEPTFLPTTYRLEINDLWVSGRAVKLSKGIYLPVSTLSALTRLPVVSDWNERTLASKTGKVPGEIFSNAWYVRLEDVPTLFGLDGQVEKDGVLRLRKPTQQAEQPAQPTAATQNTTQDATQSATPSSHSNLTQDAKNTTQNAKKTAQPATQDAKPKAAQPTETQTQTVPTAQPDQTVMAAGIAKR